MPRIFPKLTNSNSWPGLDTVDTFGLKVTFDPYLWHANVEIHLCKVRHDSEYMNIIEWDTREARDSYYDNLSDNAFTLESEFHIPPSGEVKLPIPYDVLNEYNYCFIDFPENPVEYGGSGGGVRYFYFITDISYRSPSTTAAIVSVDEWTTHSFDISYDRIYLERGHAPMTAISPEDYLERPIDSYELLGAPDDNFETPGARGRLKHTAIDVINNGLQYAVLAMTMDPYANPGTYGQSGWRTATTNNWRVNGNPGYMTIAIEPGQLSSFLDAMSAQAPQMVPCIVACFLIPQRLVTAENTISLFGYNVFVIQPAQRYNDIVTLTKSMFGYDERYDNIAKLYSYPYARLEITDERGNTRTFRVEETTGRLQLSTIASILYPMIGIDAYITGIGGDSETSISWNNFSGHEFGGIGNWTESLMHWDIPTYAIFQDATQVYDYTQYWPLYQLVDTNTSTYQLSTDTTAANLAMALAGISRQQARLQQQQAQDRAQRTMSRATAARLRDLSKGKLILDAGLDSDMASKMQAVQQSYVSLASSQSRATTQLATTSAQLAQGTAASMAEQVQLANENALAQTAIGTITSPISAGASALGGGNPAAAAAGMITSGIDAGFGVNQTLISSTSSYISARAASDQATMSLAGAQLAQQNAEASYALAFSNNYDLYAASVDLIRRKCDAATNLLDNEFSESQNLQDSSLALQQQYQNAILAADAALSQSQARQVQALAARGHNLRKRLQDQSIEVARKAAMLSTPRQVTSASGSSVQASMPAAVMVKVITQDDASISAAGDNFLKFGYSFAGREWTIETLRSMLHFSFWKGDLQIGRRGTTQETAALIHDIFERGVMVWGNESEIGETSIYDNWRQ